MKFCVKISTMDSPALDVPLSPKRPTELVKDSRSALEYFAGVVQIAADDVHSAFRSIGVDDRIGWAVRKRVNLLCAGGASPKVAELLKRHGIVITKSDPDDFCWFTVPDCSYAIHVVTRPKNGGSSLPEGGWSRQEVIDDDSVNYGEAATLYLMMEMSPEGLEAITLSLVTNSMQKWYHHGAHIIDEVVIYKAGADTVVSLPREDESFFRSEMAKRDTAREYPAESAETYGLERKIDNEQLGGDNAAGS